MANAPVTQVMTGPSASALHHAAAAVQAVTQVEAVTALWLTMLGGFVAVVATCGAVGWLLQRPLGRRLSAKALRSVGLSSYL